MVSEWHHLRREVDQAVLVFAVSADVVARHPRPLSTDTTYAYSSQDNNNNSNNNNNNSGFICSAFL